MQRKILTKMVGPMQQRQVIGRRGRGSSNEKVFSATLRNPTIWTLTTMVLGTLACISYDFTSQGNYLNVDASYLRASGISSFDSLVNAVKMSTWKSETETACTAMMAETNKKDSKDARLQKERVERDAMAKFTFPGDTRSTVPPNHQPYKYCRNVFIDLGTNIGDSIGYFVDSALDACTPIWLQDHPKTRLNQDFPRPHLDVTSLEITHKGKGNNPLYAMLQKQMNEGPYAESTTNVTPDSFCVYGMEGNPEFTDRLQKLENFVMNTEPRPVQHLHIHTESVVTAVDGSTKLYLDKTSVKENFWGSSILSSQQDAVKSANELGGGQVFSADVEGISLTTLTKKTVLAYKPEATTAESKDGLLIIKMDVEGAEYQVLKEVAASGVLCDYIEKGNRVVMIVEFHNNSITDPKERNRERTGANVARKTLESCGVEFGTLHAHWH